ncbi:MAG: LLM class flavin-dependent oxidoreductase [Rickettsiales bacterium]|nr:LLM class flavin-dependent oxidoreductase [Rickettsiales bacterium]
MEIGIDSFASNNSKKTSAKTAMKQLIERIVKADEQNLDIFGIGEHHREEFLDSAPSVILAAASSLTKNIKLTSAVSVLSAIDPVRLFQQFATLDIISNGRSEMVVGRGSFSEAFPLFGYSFDDYDAVFAEKLDLLLKIREKETITWKGKFRPELIYQSIYPRPLQKKIPIWLGVGGTPYSFQRAGKLGLPLMIAIIGGETRRFKPLIDIYKRAWDEAGHNPKNRKIGIHSLGYVAETSEKAKEEFFPGYAEVFTKIGKERGWSPVTRSHFDGQVGKYGALLVGSPKEIKEKIIQHSRDLGGINRLTFQMNVAALSHKKLMNSIDLIGKEIAPELKNN